MGEPLSKKDLDATMAAHRAYLDQIEGVQNGHPNAALISGIMKGIAPTIHELQTQIDALQARVNELERKGYVGVWKEGREYSSQSEVTHDGARWISHKRTNDKPGSSADWQMVEKSTPRSETPTANPRSNGHYANPRNPKSP